MDRGRLAISVIWCLALLGGALLIVLARRRDAKLLGELFFQKPLDYSALIFRDVRISKALPVESDILRANEPVHADPTHVHRPKYIATCWRQNEVVRI